MYQIAGLCEAVFGEKYMALAYGNLILTAALFAVTVTLARQAFVWREALLLGLAVCAASTLQHGIIWYNCLGIFLVVAVSALCVAAVRRERMGPIQMVLLTAALICAGLTKINFLGAALAVALCCFLCLALAVPRSWRTQAAAAVIITCAAVGGTVVLELASNRADLRTYLFNTLILPASRRSNLRLLLTRSFLLGTVYPYYLRNPFHAVMGFSIVLFFVVALLLKPQSGRFALRGARLSLALYFGLAALLVVTNVDICSLSESILLVGLVVTRCAFGGRLSPFSSHLLRGAAILMAVWFVAAGSLSISRHSRLLYGARPQEVRFDKQIEDGGYLDGVRLSGRSYALIETSGAILKQFQIGAGSHAVYWGPGLELLSRVYQTEPLRGVPLWYHSGITLRPQDVGPLLRLIQNSTVRLILCDEQWWDGESPDEMRTYLASRWEGHKDGDLVYYVRR
jgi:hypothetical protein